MAFSGQQPQIGASILNSSRSEAKEAASISASEEENIPVTGKEDIPVSEEEDIPISEDKDMPVLDQDNIRMEGINVSEPASDKEEIRIEFQSVDNKKDVNPSPYSQYNPSPYIVANSTPVKFDPVIELNFVSNSAYERYQKDRNNFIRKVISLLGIQFSFTMIFVAFVTKIPDLRSFVKNNLPLYITSIAGATFVCGLVFCTRKYSRQYPYNYIALCSFTVFETYFVGWICSLYSPESVLTCVMMTLGITLALVYYAYKTERDFTSKRGVLIVILVSLFFFGISISFNYDRILGSVIALCIAILYGWFIVYDIQLIAGGKYSELSMDDYIIGALMLYIDICRFLIYLLSLIGRNANDDAGNLVGV